MASLEPVAPADAHIHPPLVSPKHSYYAFPSAAPELSFSGHLHPPIAGMTVAVGGWGGLCNHPLIWM